MQANKLFLSLAGGATLLVAAGSAMAGIANTKHNIGTTGTWNSMSTANVLSTTEICVFCHTPHGADASQAAAAGTSGALSSAAPLWNRKLPATGTAYKTYDQLGTATFDAKVATSGIGSVSLACLSCHDGGQAFNAVLNAPGSGTDGNNNTTNAFQQVSNAIWKEFNSFSVTSMAGGSTNGDNILNIGNNLVAGTYNSTSGQGDLRDDHPVSIEYCGGGYTNATGTGAGACVDKDFKAPSSGLINSSIQFWVDTPAGAANVREKTDLTLYRRTFPGGVGPSVECASCHDPHIDNKTFLRDVLGNNTGTQALYNSVGNAGSRVCLSCHTK